MVCQRPKSLSPRPDKPLRRWTGWSFALGVVLAFPPAAPATAGDYQDIRHTLLARKVLEDDPALATLNLGVKVENRVATLWGPVPSLELGGRAAERLRGRSEFRDVRNDLYFAVNDLFGNLPSPPLFLPEPPAEVRRPAPPPGKPPTPDFRPAMATISLLHPIQVEEKLPTYGRVRPPAGSHGVLLARPTLAKQPPGKQAPIVPFPTKDKVLPGVIVLRPELPPAEKTLEQSLREIHRGQERFHRIHLEVQGSRVILRGRPAESETLHDLARHVARVPGVERVLVQEK